jgi:paxillin
MLGLLCPECEKPIFGKCVNARGVRYHPDHFKCEFCKKPLAGKRERKKEKRKKD